LLPIGRFIRASRASDAWFSWASRQAVSRTCAFGLVSIGGLAVVLGGAGWAFPVPAPPAVPLVGLPLVYALATPSRHVVQAFLASARTFVTTAAASAGVAALFVDWPATLRVASATATVLHGVVLPWSAPAWAAARGRLGRVPGWATWLAAAATLATVAVLR
jgi:hypothetical protein